MNLQRALSLSRGPVLAGIVGAGALFVARDPEVAAVAIPEPAPENWCAPNLEPIEGGGCFAAPERERVEDTPLLVYLHGRYSPDTVREEMDRQARVAIEAVARGFAVLALRGTQGECTQPEYATYWCWPSNERNAGDGPSFVARWQPALRAAKLRAGPGPNVLLGFSNGGYFATLIVTRGLFDFDAVAIAHAGPVQPTRALGQTPPILLITATEDVSDPEMRRLDDELTRENWPHSLASRGGGHALPDWDIDTALTFFLGKDAGGL